MTRLPMTPEEARDYMSGRKTMLHTSTPLAALETLAAMREEWGCHWEDAGVGPWHEDRERAMFDLSMGYPFFVEKGKPRPKGRVVRRYVTGVIADE